MTLVSGACSPRLGSGTEVSPYRPRACGRWACLHPDLKRDAACPNPGVLSSLRWSALFRLMADFYDFDDVFGSNPNIAYDEQSRAKIHHNRQLLENELFIDRLLKALGVRKGMLR